MRMIMSMGMEEEENWRACSGRCRVCVCMHACADSGVSLPWFSIAASPSSSMYISRLRAAARQ